MLTTNQFVQAVEEGDRKTADVLVKAGFDPYGKLPRTFWAIPSLLHYFTERCQAEPLERLIEWYPAFNPEGVWDYYYVRGDSAVPVFHLLIQIAGLPPEEKLRKIYQETLSLIKPEITYRSTRTKRKYSPLSDLVKTIEEYFTKLSPSQIRQALTDPTLDSSLRNNYTNYLADHRSQLENHTSLELSELAQKLGIIGTYKRKDLINLIEAREGTSRRPVQLTDQQLDSIGQLAQISLQGTPRDKAHQLADHFKRMY